MSLNALLELQRTHRHSRLQRAREAEHRQRRASGLPMRTGKRETLEMVAAAMTAKLFTDDLDKLLTARSARLCIVWKRNTGQLYVESPEGSEVLQDANKKKGMLKVCYQGDMGQRIAHFLDHHDVEMMIGWVSGKLVLQCGSRDVSDTHCLRLIETTENRKCRYMMSSEEPGQNKQQPANDGAAA